LDQALADRAKGRIDLLKNATATQLRVAELEQELKEVREAAAAEKKKLEDELVEEKRKTKEANAQFNVVNIGMVKTFTLVTFS
jgi:septal ring factor EnvC (AmiA/AmiB activator)